MIEAVQHICLFETDLGWTLLAGSNRQVQFLTFGCSSPQQARQRWVETMAITSDPDRPSTDWYPEARLALENYARGAEVDFSLINCDISTFTPFQQQVLEMVRQIPRGQVLTYGQVAAKVDRPGAARAVGSTMARNRIPLIYPCHRVIGSNGNLTGFSAPRGVALKQQLLEMERLIVDC